MPGIRSAWSPKTKWSSVMGSPAPFARPADQLHRALDKQGFAGREWYYWNVTRHQAQCALNERGAWRATSSLGTASPRPVTSPCLSRRQDRAGISRCSSWTMSTASGSGDSPAWMSWWNTTRRHPSSPTSTGRSSISSGPCSDGTILRCWSPAVTLQAVLHSPLPCSITTRGPGSHAQPMASWPTLEAGG